MMLTRSFGFIFIYLILIFCHAAVIVVIAVVVAVQAISVIVDGCVVGVDDFSRANAVFTILLLLLIL